MSAVGSFSTEEAAGYRQPEAKTQRSSSEFQPIAFTADDIWRNTLASIDNQIQDLLHTQIDAERK